MWADTLLQAEQHHLLRLLVWAASSVVAGTAILVALAARRTRSPLLAHFALQTGAWGTVEAVIAGIGWRASHLRDLAAATRLERLVWMNVGLDLGYVGVGVVLAIAAWAWGKRLGGVGAGTAIVVQGAALVLLDLQFAAVISR